MHKIHWDNSNGRQFTGYATSFKKAMKQAQSVANAPWSRGFALVEHAGKTVRVTKG